MLHIRILYATTSMVIRTATIAKTCCGTIEATGVSKRLGLRGRIVSDICLSQGMPQPLLFAQAWGNQSTCGTIELISRSFARKVRLVWFLQTTEQ